MSVPASHEIRAARVRQLVLESAAHHNVLPLTSACNVRCVFCSHSVACPQLDVYRLPPVDADLVRDAVSFLSPERKVVIGESATRLIEGEPFTHPRFFDFLAATRRRLPDTPIQVTTNGTLLGEAAVSRLAAVAPVSVSLSLNSSQAEIRRAVMGDPNPEVALTAPSRLSARGIPFEISVAAVPGMVGREGIIETIEFAAARGARRAKVYLTGCSEQLLRRNGWRVSPEEWTELYDCLEEWRSTCPVPVTLQPPRLRNLTAQVCGVSPKSPAAVAGIRVGDVLLQVGGQTVESRSHAFRLLRAGGPVGVTVRRGDDSLTLELPAGDPDAEVGIVLDDDLDPARLRQLRRTLTSPRWRPTLVLTSTLAESLLRDAVTRSGAPPGTTVAAAESRLFGGTIGCAGLLTNGDFIECARRLLRRADVRYRAIVVPAEAYDQRGCDLTGRSYLEVEEALGVPVVVV